MAQGAITEENMNREVWSSGSIANIPSMTLNK